MEKLSGYIATGALAFLKAEYRMLAVFVVIAGAALGVLSAMKYIPTWYVHSSCFCNRTCIGWKHRNTYCY